MLLVLFTTLVEYLNFLKWYGEEGNAILTSVVGASQCNCDNSIFKTIAVTSFATLVVPYIYTQSKKWFKIDTRKRSTEQANETKHVNKCLMNFAISIAGIIEESRIKPQTRYEKIKSLYDNLDSITLGRMGKTKTSPSRKHLEIGNGDEDE